LCDKFRDDALRVFISGLRRSLSDVLFSAKPKDMPTALALAQEVESNHERYTFATSFAKSLEDRDRKTSPKEQRRQQDRNFSQTDPQLGINKNPYYTKQVKAQVHSDLRNNKLQSRPEPMEVDPSAKVSIPAQAPPYQNRRPATSEPTGAPRTQQRVNLVTQSSDQEGKSYANAASSAIAEINDDAICEYDSDVVHFLGENPCCPSSDEE